MCILASRLGISSYVIDPNSNFDPSIKRAMSESNENIIRRSQRKEPNFQEHSIQSKNAITAIVNKMNRFDSVCVLGVRILEVPLKLLANRFREIVLVDADETIFEAAIAQIDASDRIKVKVIVADLSGHLKDLSSKVKQIISNELLTATYIEALPVDYKSPEFVRDMRFDLVISANNLSQFPVFAGQFINQRNAQFTVINKQNQITDLFQAMQISHLRDIKTITKSGGQVFISTDLYSQVVSYDGRNLSEQRASGAHLCVKEISKLFADRALTKWTWDLPFEKTITRYSMFGIHLTPIPY